MVKLDKYVTIITNSRPSLTKAPVAANTEDTPQGPLPKIASNGREPMEVYGKSVPMGSLHSDAPKIVLILGGMGLNEKLTRQAIGYRMLQLLALPLESMNNAEKQQALTTILKS